jgi:hypothetical protein
MSEPKQQNETLPWYKRLIQAQFPSESFEFDSENEPEWVENILVELVQQAMPAFPFRKLDKVTPKELGRLIGQHRANLAAVASAGVTIADEIQSLNESFNRFGREAITAAWDEATPGDSAAFFQGLAEGFSKPGIVERSPVHATTATPIYQILFLTRNEVKRLKSVRELREFLLRRGLSVQMLGEPKRLEKICERIGLSFMKRGRPKRAK